MSIATQTKDPQAAVPVAREDLIAAWTVLENLAVSLHRIGSVYAIPQGEVDQTSEQRQGMLESLDDYFSPELVQQILRGRRALADYLPDEEAEAISDRLEYWRPQPHPRGA